MIASPRPPLMSSGHSPPLLPCACVYVLHACACTCLCICVCLALNDATSGASGAPSPCTASASCISHHQHRMHTHKLDPQEDVWGTVMVDKWTNVDLATYEQLPPDTPPVPGLPRQSPAKYRFDVPWTTCLRWRPQGDLLVSCHALYGPFNGGTLYLPGEAPAPGFWGNGSLILWDAVTHARWS